MHHVRRHTRLPTGQILTIVVGRVVRTQGLRARNRVVIMHLNNAAEPPVGII